MEVHKVIDSHFADCFYVDNELDYSNPPRFLFGAADTETHLFYNNEQLSEEVASNLMRENGQKWCKENIEVRPWAYMLYVEQHFMCFTNIDDFMTMCAMLRLKTIVWYNAKFDFAIFDYYFLTRNWKTSQEVVKDKDKKVKLPHGTYDSLQSDMGARYKMTIWHKYINLNKKEKVHKFSMIDLLNVMQGGLAKCLKSWDVRDSEGNPIRKLTMDYVNDNLEDCVQYLVNDTMGLYYLVKQFNEVFYDISGLSYVDGEFLTSGSIGKKMLLHEMYQNIRHSDNVKDFQRDFYMDAKLDAEYRENHLYLGGKTLVNKEYLGKVVSNVYKLDVNSLYPYIMSTMNLPYGRGKISYDIVETEDIQIIHITSMSGTLKPNMIGMWYDLTTHEYVDIIDEVKPFYFFKDELDELENWYDLLYEYDFVVTYKAGKNPGMKEFVDKLYDVKMHTTGSKKLSAKIPLNAAYGKLAQRVNQVKGHNELTEGGYVHYVIDGEVFDRKAMLSIVVGSRVTSLARQYLMEHIRLMTGGNVKKNFVYCDTDSIHTFTVGELTDDKEIGKFKIEGINDEPYDKALYIAPKSYIMVHKSYYEGRKDEDSLVVHCKGVTPTAVRDKLYECNNMEEMTHIFRANYPIKCLAGINAIGGRALIYVDKMILKQDKEDIMDATAGDGVFYDI